MNSIRLRRIISSLAFAVLLLGAITGCARVLEQKEARIEYEPFFKSSTNFDVVMLGTSHMWNHVLPMELWKDYGIASYNWGYSNCTPAENYYLIKDILKYTSPRVVVMDVYGIVEYEELGNGKYQSGKIEQQHVQFDEFPIWSRSKYEASRDVFDDYENNEDFVWDFIKYHNRWSQLEAADFNYEISTEKGAQFLTGLGGGWFVPIDENERAEIDSVCYPYFLEIIEYCEEQGIEVLCVYLPMASCDDNEQRIAQTIGDIVEQYPNCKYENMMNKDILNFYTDACPDNVHLNYSGASKVTDRLGEYLVSNYEFDDYSENGSWIKDYEAYHDYKVKSLKAQTNLADYLVLLRDDDFEAELEVYNLSLMNDYVFGQLCENAGIVPEYVENETDLCAVLTITDRATGELVEEAGFSGNTPEMALRIK